MPDITAGDLGSPISIILHPNEICASCKNSGSCPLIQVLHENNILTWDGMRVQRCDLYVADESSPHYVAEDDAVARADAQVADLKDKLDRLNKAAGKVFNANNIQ
jgi:hypothetical protein